MTGPEVAIAGARALIDELHATIGRFGFALGLAPYALVWTDAQGRIVWCNAVFDRFAHADHLALIGSPLTRHLVLARDGSPLESDHPACRILAGDDHIVETYESGERLVEVFARGGEIGGAWVAFLAIHDVTDRIRADREMRLLNTQLAAANAELEAFAYSVSHDLRTPLRAIDGFSHLLLEDYGAALDEQGRDFLARLRSAAQSMGRLIDDLLRLSRVTRGELQWADVDISAMCRDIVADLVAGAPQRRVAVTIADGLSARGDENLLRQVFRNLLDNAWKFTQRVADPRIEVGTTDGADDEPVFYVRDNGAGFEMRRADKLFGAFQRLHGADEFPGTGIGLAIVRRIVHRHGGQVWAESEIGRGATFYLTLPNEDAVTP